VENRSIVIRRQQPLVKIDKQPDIEIGLDELPQQAEPPRKVITPKVDIRESADEVIMLVDMPGIDRHDIQLTIDQGELKLVGHAESHMVEKRHLEYGEYESCDYERVFVLSKDLDVPKIEAEIRSGVLRIVLPKTAAARPKKIKVYAG